MTDTSPIDRHYQARAALREALDDPLSTDQPGIDRLWAEYDDAYHAGGGAERDPEYDDLEARTRDALIGYADDRIRR